MGLVSQPIHFVAISKQLELYIGLAVRPYRRKLLAADPLHGSGLAAYPFRCNLQAAGALHRSGLAVHPYRRKLLAAEALHRSGLAAHPYHRKWPTSVWSRSPSISSQIAYVGFFLNLLPESDCGKRNNSLRRVNDDPMVSSKNIFCINERYSINNSLV